MDRYTPLYEQVGEHLDHIVGGQPSSHPHRQTFPREFIDHIQNAELDTIVRAIFHEVITPDMLGERRLQPDH